MRFKASIEEQQQPSPFEVFVMHMLHAATNAHILHWQRKFPQHVALGEFYEALPDMLDKLVEAYQGRKSKLKNYPTDFKLPPDDPVVYMQSLQDELDNLRVQPGFPQESQFQNEVDNIANLISSTLYKVRDL